jgi:hypothetical protein
MNGGSFVKGRPNREYKSWALFLISNPEWLDAENEDQLTRLYEHFMNFGRAIGDDNMAVWFLKPKRKGSLASITDVEGCSAYAKLYGLMPSRGPHILIIPSPRDQQGKTVGFPDTTQKVDQYYVLELNGLSPARVGRLLAEVSDRLLVDTVYASGFGSIEQWNAWNRVITKVSKPVLRILQYVTFKLKRKDFELSVGVSAPQSRRKPVK